MTTSTGTHSDVIKNNIYLYIALAGLVFVELYFLPLRVAPELYFPISFPHAHLEAHILLFLTILLFSLLRKSDFAPREEPDMRFLPLHLLFCGLFFAFLFYLVKIFPFVSLPDTHPLIVIARFFNKRAGALIIRYRAVFLLLFACCHYSLFSIVFRAKNIVKKYVFSIILSFFIAEFSGTILWKLLAKSVAKINYMLLALCGLPAKLTFLKEGDPMLGTDSFMVGIAYTCAGLEGITLFLVIFIFALLSRWEEINKRKAVIVGVCGVLIMCLANILRIFTLILVGHFISPQLALKAFHTYAGMVLYTITIVIIFLVSYKWMLIDAGDSKSSKVLDKK
ncbi:MAG: archaeosortase/exosortase family protein [Candidatus Omnitrophota bacterium]|nr:archaeosortase/exosortase family protein [Candidatus Omnitrophota bacterium]